jgi:hypothetical protein
MNEPLSGHSGFPTFIPKVEGSHQAIHVPHHVGGKSICVKLSYKEHQVHELEFTIKATKLDFVHVLMDFFLSFYPSRRGL